MKKLIETDTLNSIKGVEVRDVVDFKKKFKFDDDYAGSEIDMMVDIVRVGTELGRVFVKDSQVQVYVDGFNVTFHASGNEYKAYVEISQASTIRFMNPNAIDKAVYNLLSGLTDLSNIIRKYDD